MIMKSFRASQFVLIWYVIHRRSPCPGQGEIARRRKMSLRFAYRIGRLGGANRLESAEIAEPEVYAEADHRALKPEGSLLAEIGPKTALRQGCGPHGSQIVIEPFEFGRQRTGDENLDTAADRRPSQGG